MRRRSCARKVLIIRSAVSMIILAALASFAVYIFTIDGGMTASPAWAPGEGRGGFGTDPSTGPGASPTADAEPGVTTVYLDPGHGGIDDGAVRDGIKEKDINLKIAKLVRELAEEDELGIHIILSRDEDSELNAEERAKEASELADILVSIHCNAFGEAGEDNDVSGTEVHYSPNKTRDSAELAQSVLDGVCDSTGSKNRGLFDKTDLIINNASTIPSVLIEMGFMSNAEERDNLNDTDYQRKAAEGIYRGIIAALGL